MCQAYANMGERQYRLNFYRAPVFPVHLVHARLPSCRLNSYPLISLLAI